MPPHKGVPWRLNHEVYDVSREAGKGPSSLFNVRSNVCYVQGPASARTESTAALGGQGSQRHCPHDAHPRPSAGRTAHRGRLSPPHLHLAEEGGVKGRQAVARSTTHFLLRPGSETRTGTYAEPGSGTLPGADRPVTTEWRGVSRKRTTDLAPTLTVTPLGAS